LYIFKHFDHFYGRAVPRLDIAVKSISKITTRYFTLFKNFICNFKKIINNANSMLLEHIGTRLKLPDVVNINFIYVFPSLKGSIFFLGRRRFSLM